MIYTALLTKWEHDQDLKNHVMSSNNITPANLIMAWHYSMNNRLIWNVTQKYIKYHIEHTLSMPLLRQNNTAAIVQRNKF